MKNTFFSLLSLSILVSCSTTNIKLAKISADEIETSIARGSCYGNCPVYSLNVYGKGRAEFIGKKNVSKIGTYEKQLGEETYAALRKAIAEADVHQFEDEYPSDIADLPTVVMTFRDINGFKSIKGKETRPEKILELEKILSEIANSDGWTNLNPDEDTVKDEKEPDYIKSEIIIEPRPGLLLPKWFNEMKGLYGIRLIKRLSSESNTWLIAYDKAKASPDEMIEILKNDESIINAEFNKKVEMR